MDGRVLSEMRSIGLDLGTKTIGIAVSDELGFTAQGRPTLARRGPRKDLEALRLLAEEVAAERFILGLPINMNGTEGPRAEATRAFGAALGQATGLPVVFQDERLTTAEANRTLLEADVSRKRRREVVDQLAASLILQGWLDAQPRREP